MTRVLLDQGLPRSAVMPLRAAGWDVVHVSDVGMSRASDADILLFARNEARTCVTLDADFHSLLVADRVSAPSVVRIRIEGLKGVELAALLLRVWRRIEEDIAFGAMVSITVDRMRIRRLPVGP